MKNYCILIYIAVVSVSCSPTRIYFVRHAEKSLDVKVDPPLTPEGAARAAELANILKGKGILSIYSTKTTRTATTAQPLAEKLGIPIRFYSHDTMPRFLYTLLASGETALVVGHSNTVLKMISELELSPSQKEIPDSVYDNLYIVSLKNRNSRSGYRLLLKETTFGKPSR